MRTATVYTLPVAGPAETALDASIDGLYDQIDSALAEMGTARERIAELGDSVAELRKRVAQLVAEREARFVLAADPSADFTEAERRVAVHIVSPMTVPEIARHMYLTANTVKTHFKSIYRKLGVSTRAQAAAVLTARRRESVGGERS